MNGIDTRPMRKKFFKGFHALWLALLLVTAAVFTASDAEATHFRFGHITWKATGTNTAEITVLHAWRCTFFFSSSACTSGSIVGGGVPTTATFNFGGGSPATSNLTGTVIFNDAANGWFLAKYVTTHAYPSQGPFTASFSNCCRISTLQNSNADDAFLVTTDIDFRNGNKGSPVSSIPPIVQLPKTSPGNFVTFSLPTADPDLDSITCRLATTAESSLTTAAPNAALPLPVQTLSVTSDCKLVWDTSETTFSQLYALQVMLQEHRPNNVINDVALDFIIEIANVTLNAQPTCTVNGSASNIVNVGQNFSITVTGNDTDGGNLTVNHLGLPPGATLTPTSGSSGAQPLTATFNWTPQSSDAGSAHAISILFTDPGNLTATCSFSINVPANQPPDAICKDVTVNADANCQAGADINNGSFDPDGDPITLAQSPAAPPATPFGLGNTLTTLTVTDNKNASDSCQATVTVKDVTAPSITCPVGQSVECTGSGSATATFAATATDNCSVGSPSCNPASGSTFPLGPTTVSCTATDGSGNSSQCTTTVTVKDTQAPSITCPAPTTVLTSSQGGACVASLPVSATATDTCNGTISAICSPSLLSLSAPGSTSSTCNAADTSGNSSSCNTSLALVDDTAPTVSCPAPVTAECTGGGGATVTTAATATDNCAGPLPASGPGTVFYALGTTSISYSASDPSTNSASCSSSVQVQDTTPPSITCPAAIVAECTGNSSAQVTPGAASASDICAGVTVAGPAAGTYPVGTTTVAYTATDGVGLQSSCQATIQVVDTIKPVVSCVESVNPSGKNVPNAKNEDGFYKVSGGDACSAPAIMLGSFAIANGETIKITQTPGKSGVSFVNTMGQENIRHFQVGPGDAVITATDGSGNSSSVTCLVPPPPK